jgi:hypothetical protein
MATEASEATDLRTSRSTWQRETAIAAGSLAFGLLVLPFAVYFVGQRLLGDYGEGEGGLSLAESIWLDLLALRLPAWILVLSPYFVVQLARLVRRVWRRAL